MKISGTDVIKEYIPQREPIMMVDCIEEIAGASVLSGLTILEDNLFVEDGIFREPGIIEHMAQSAAADMGYRLKQQNKAVPVGFIAAIKNLSIKKKPCVGDSIYTKILITNQVLDITIVQIQTFLREEEIACCEMRIFAKGS